MASFYEDIPYELIKVVEPHILVKVAKEMGCQTIGMSGRDGGKMNEVCDINLVVPSNDTPRIQEMHILI